MNTNPIPTATATATATAIAIATATAIAIAIAADKNTRTGRALGFSLIELLVVVAIIAILAFLTLPNITDKLARDQIVEASRLADMAKGPVQVFWAASGSKKLMPADNVAAGLPLADKIVSNYISSLTVEGGAIHLQFGNSAHGVLKGKVLTLRPAIVDDAPTVPISWVCAGGKVPDKMSIKGMDKTTIEKRYLPRNCM